MTSIHDFPTTGVELRYLLVASDYARSLAFYRDVLGARVVREISDVLCLLSFGGAEILLTVGGGPTKDKPMVTFAPPTDADRVSSELNIRVPDCFAAYGRSHRRWWRIRSASLNVFRAGFSSLGSPEGAFFSRSEAPSESFC